MISWTLMTVALLGYAPPSVELTGKFDTKLIPESSGIVKSRRYPGIFWVHNDSANPPKLFAVRLDAQVANAYRIAVPNIDWEDLTLDDEGHLYLGDIGNNSGLLRIRSVYRIDEPDPHQSSTNPLVPSASYFFELPKAKRFDAESLFHENGLLNLIEKNRDGRDPAIYQFRLDHPAPINRPATLKLVAKLPSFPEPATGASLSRDGRYLAVCSTSVLRIYVRNASESWQLDSEVNYPQMAAEGVTWDDHDLILAVEGDGLYRVKHKTWHDASRPLSAQPTATRSPH